MKCNNCGTELENGVKFCGACGTPADAAPVEETATPVAEAAEEAAAPASADVENAAAPVEAAAQEVKAEIPVVEPTPVAIPVTPPQQQAPVQQTPPVYQAPPVQQMPPQQPPMQGFNQAPQFNQPQFNPGMGTPVNGTMYLVLSIIATVLCCLPFGIAGIVFATKINQLNLVGDYQGAQKAAKSSMIFTIVAAASGIIAGIAYGIFIAATGARYY